MRPEIGVKDGLGITAAELSHRAGLAPVDKDIAVGQDLRVALRGGGDAVGGDEAFDLGGGVVGVVELEDAGARWRARWVLVWGLAVSAVGPGGVVEEGYGLDGALGGAGEEAGIVLVGKGGVFG